MTRSSSYHSNEFKHTVCTYYDNNKSSLSLRSVASSFNIPPNTLSQWYSRWKRNKSINAFIIKEKRGRKRILNKRDINKYITNKIIRANRSGTPISYPELYSAAIEDSNKQFSFSTFKNYGIRDAGIKSNTTIKTTEWECKCIYKILDISSLLYYLYICVYIFSL